MGAGTVYSFLVVRCGCGWVAPKSLLWNSAYHVNCSDNSDELRLKAQRLHGLIWNEKNIMMTMTTTMMMMMMMMKSRNDVFFSSSECWIRSLAISLSRSLAIRFPNTYATPILVSCHHYHRHQDHHHHRHPMQHLLSSSAKSGNIDHCHWLMLLCNVNYDYSSQLISREQCSKILVGRL